MWLEYLRGTGQTAHPILSKTSKCATEEDALNTCSSGTGGESRSGVLEWSFLKDVSL